MKLASRGRIHGALQLQQQRRAGLVLARGHSAAMPLPQLQLTPASLGISPSTNPLPTSYRSVTTDPHAGLAIGSAVAYAPGPPQLMSRHITLNPLHGLVGWVEARLVGVDVAMAVALDSRPLAQVAAAAVMAALTCTGLHPISVLCGKTPGLPPLLGDWLEVHVGGWTEPLVLLAALAVGAAAALWHLRTWWAGHLALVRPDAPLQEAQAARAAAAASAASTSGAAQSAVGASASGGADNAAEAAAGADKVGPFSRFIPAFLKGVIEPDFKLTDKTWVYCILAARLTALFSAAASLAAGATTSAAAYAGVCFVASLLPVALPHLRALISSAPGGAAAATRLAAPLLAADAAYLVALAPAAPLTARAAAAAVAAAALLTVALGAAATSRLAPMRAAGGDVVTFDLTVRIPLSGTPLDSTIGHRPLSAVVQPPASSSSAPPAGTSADAASAADPTSALSAPPPSGTSRTAGSVAANADPQARFLPLAELLASSGALDGLMVGETRTFPLLPPADADSNTPVFSNPGLVWWQPLDDLQRKLGLGTGTLPQPGEVFAYPVGGLVSELGTLRLSRQQLAAQEAAGSEARLPGRESWGLVQVVGVTDEWVQLDGNIGAVGGVELQVEVLSVSKGER